MDYNLSEYHKQLSQMPQSQAKIFINSYYPIIGNQGDFLYDTNIVSSITNTDKSITKDIKKF